MGKPRDIRALTNVPRYHQTKNAMALVEKEAAMMIPDDEAVERVIPARSTLLRTGRGMNFFRKTILALSISGLGGQDS